MVVAASCGDASYQLGLRNWSGWRQLQGRRKESLLQEGFRLLGILPPTRQLRKEDFQYYTGLVQIQEPELSN